MVQDAENFAEEDKVRREQVENRNQAEALIHGAEKSISDLGDKADPALKSEVEEAVTTLKTALEGDDDAEIKDKSEALSAVLMKMGEAAYQAEQQAGGDTSDASDNTASADDNDVVDADFEEVDDSKSAKNG